MDALPNILSSGPAKAFLTLLVAGVLAGMVSLLFRWLLFRVARRTETELDDLAVRALRMPAAGSIALGGLWYALEVLHLPPPIPYLLDGLLFTFIALIWGISGSRLVTGLLHWLAANRQRYGALITSRTEPVFDVVGKTVVYGATLYFIFLAWKIDLTGWLASAGIIGVAVGFASQDTLSNLVAGLVILADAPYKLDDFLVLETGQRGRVTEIGMLVTRILTLDDVEIIVPNRMMVTTRVLNESGGPYEKFRLKVPLRVAYGTDVDQVRALLTQVALETEHVAPEPRPLVRFMAFGEFAIELTVQAWVVEPKHADNVLDDLHGRIYKALLEARVEIPVPRQDVRVRPVPDAKPGAIG